MKLLKNESGQAGGLFTVVVGIFISGFFIVAFGAIMNQLQIANNDIITSDLPYSQDHYNAMDMLFKYWWGLPIITLILFVIYGIKNALTKTPGQV